MSTPCIHIKILMQNSGWQVQMFCCIEKEQKILEHNKALEMMLARLIWGLPRAKGNKQPPAHLEG
jgi:hypothetical protein